MIKGIIFDLDDTLYNASDCYKKGMAALSVFVKSTFDMEDICFREKFSEAKQIVKERLGNVAASHNRQLYCQAFLELIGESPVGHALQMYNTFWDTALDNMHLYDYVWPLFKELKADGIKIAILSDLTANIQHRKIEKLGISDYIDVLVTSEEAGEEKPSLKMFELTMRKLGISADELLMVGDSRERDVVGAQKANITAIHFTDEKNFKDQVRMYL